MRILVSKDNADLSVFVAQSRCVDELDQSAQAVTQNGKPIPHASKEFQLLRCQKSRAGSAVHTQKIAAKGSKFASMPPTNSTAARNTPQRRKNIDAFSSPNLIRTACRASYCLPRPTFLNQRRHNSFSVRPILPDLDGSQIARAPEWP